VRPDINRKMHPNNRRHVLWFQVSPPQKFQLQLVT